MTLTRDIRTWPDWWACVASYDIEEMPQADERVLFEAARRLAAASKQRPRPRGMPISMREDDSLTSKPLPHRFSEGANPFDFEEGHEDYERALSETMERARFMACITISEVLLGRAADIDGYRQSHPRRLAWLDDGQNVHVFDATEDPITVSFHELFRPGRRFPLAQCPNEECGRVFAWVGPQKFCSTSCQSKVREAARSGTPARKETLRRAAQEYRERQRMGRKTAKSKGRK